MEKCCTFFGHRDCPVHIRPRVYESVVDLIENYAVTMFYVGNHGAFDRMVRGVLRELTVIYPQIRYGVVLAYMPSADEDQSDTMLPEGIETAPKRFAITWRNRWMLRQADYVVSYVTHDWGGAAQFVQQARRKGKKIIDLA